MWVATEVFDDTYYLMESEALQTLSDFFGIDFKDMAEAMILVRENNGKNTSCPDQFAQLLVALQ